MCITILLLHVSKDTNINVSYDNKTYSVTTRKVGRDMAAYTPWLDRVCQQL